MKFFIPCIALCLLALNSQAESTRIEVYPVSQAFVDVQRGDTLGEIVSELLPVNASRRSRLMAEIVELNPDAFIDKDPNRLKANVRLWLPGHTLGPRKKLDTRKYRIREFSWGYVQQLKH